MQPWTKWFRERQESVGTIEEFAQASGVAVRMVSAYRAGTIPRRSDQIAKIQAFLGEAGPLPGSRREELRTFGERIAALEEGMAELRGRVAVLELADAPNGASSDPASPPAAIPDLSGTADVRAARRGAAGQRSHHPRGPKPRE